MKRHQAMIDEKALPGVTERYDHAEKAAAHLVGAGYVRIGIDHFALPHDALAVAMREGSVQRNFQGYTVDPADALIGLGASAIGKLPQGYVQNTAAIAEYQRQAATKGLATAKGIALSDDDMARAHVIERLMCDLTFSRSDLLRRFGDAAAPLLLDAAQIMQSDRDDFIVPTEDGFRVNERGRPFLRTVAAQFDSYLPMRQARHSLAV
jgi:oxygen-independent coproporphyrinogen-3 oxidase